MAEYPILHIYEQASHHLDAHIFGTREGLLKLRAAIDAALEGKHENAEVCPSDGECYDCVVRCVTPSWAKALPASYVDFPADWTPDENAAFHAAMDGRAYG